MIETTLYQGLNHGGRHFQREAEQCGDEGACPEPLAGWPDWEVAGAKALFNFK